MKLAFDSQQEKDETLSAQLERLKRNFQLYSGVDPDSPEGQVLIKVPFVPRAWVDIRRKLEKTDEQNEKDLNELLWEAQKIYLRREEKKTKTKAKIMVAIAKGSVGTGESEPKGNRQEGNTERRPELERQKRQPRTD